MSVAYKQIKVENVQAETVWLAQGAQAQGQAQGLCWSPLPAILSSKYMGDLKDMLRISPLFSSVKYRLRFMSRQ